MATMGTRKIEKLKLARNRGKFEANPLTIPIYGGLNIFHTRESHSDSHELGV